MQQLQADVARVARSKYNHRRENQDDQNYKADTL